MVLSKYISLVGFSALLSFNAVTSVAAERDEETFSFKSHRFELNIGVGGEAYFAKEEFTLGIMDIDYLPPKTLKNLCNGSYDVHISATRSLGWAYRLNEHVSLVGSLGYNKVKATYFNPITDVETGRETIYRYDVMVGVRARYYDSKYFSCYSQLQYGAAFRSPGLYWDYNSLSRRNTAFQFTIIGLTLGESFYYLFEYGWGTEYYAEAVIAGIRIGVGFRF